MDVTEHGSNNSEEEHIGISQNKFQLELHKGPSSNSTLQFFGLKHGQKAAALTEGLVNW